MTKRKVLIVGDSHVYAIKAAADAIAGHTGEFEFVALRLSTEKNSTKIGDIDLPDLLIAAADLRGDDALVTTLRGNEYNIMGLMRHPRPFDIMIPGFADLPEDTYEELIPYATAYSFMFGNLKRGHGRQLCRIAKASAAPMFCLSAPAPKEDEAHILGGADTYFRKAGIADIGVSPAPLRLKLWELQDRALAKFCSEARVTLLSNPPGTRDAGGYLDRAYYAGDATHANAAYGALVLDQIAAMLTN
ncbi:hypothetical protein JNB71_14245 [Rhizobium herbae]|uniref:SGNH/GDSL hydrolase family protein n=1 Tax=Rhizobium herbae TaxID=508661 RepID=A0ABS7HCF7_9HYPH|nr:hypothetical protein [Rhizobium herbae]MBW9064485.1 hypothetical protein [Rhizobium herbae]